MFSYKRELPEGLEDVLRERQRRVTRVEDRLLRLYSLSGYNEVQSPTFEYLDVFASLGGALQVGNMIKFVDPSGKILVWPKGRWPQKEL